MWFYKGTKVKYFVYQIKNRCSTKLQNKSYTNNHNYCRVHQNLLNSVSYTIDIIQFKNCEKFSPIVNQNRHFLKCQGYCYTNSVNCSYTKASKAAINCSYIYCERGCDKVLQTHAFISNAHTYVHWCYNSNLDLSTK